MGDSKLAVTKAEIFELARSMGADINNVQARIHGLSVALDCLIAVLTNAGIPDAHDKSLTIDFAGAVKLEIQRRIEAAKTKQTDGPYDPTAPVNIAAHEKARRERTGCYAPGASDDPDK